MPDRLLNWVAPVGSFFGALIVAAFGYGKVNQRINHLESYRQENRDEHQKIFDKLDTISEHMGAVKQWMKNGNRR